MTLETMVSLDVNSSHNVKRMNMNDSAEEETLSSAALKLA